MSSHDSAISLLAELKDIGCWVWVKDGKLKVSAPKAGITEELKGRLKTNREKILEHLDSFQSQDARLPDEIPVLPPGSPQVMSYAQQRLWFLDRYEGGSSVTYNMPAALRLEGTLDIHALQSSLHWMVERHESLRMTFPERDGEAGVVVLSNPDFEFPMRDLRDPSLAGQQLQQRIDEHAERPFDLARGPLFRAEILQLAKEDGQAVHVLLINMHHIISDGWSIGIFVREWQEAYAAFAKGEPPALAPLPIQYTDYAAWQRQWLQGEVLEEQLAWWKDNLADIPDLLELPTDYPRPAQLNYRGSHYSQTLPADITAAIRDLSREQGVSLFMALLAAFNVLLARYSGQNDICVGSPIANRTHTHTENLLGFFVNTLVLRTRLNPEQGFRELLQQVRQTCLGAYAHQDIPFETLVEQINPTRSLSHSPLFQVMLALQNNAPVEMELPGLTITTLEQDYPIAKFDLTLFVEEQNGRLHCIWEYATSLFAEDTIRRMGEHFEVLLRGIVAEPETRISQLPLLTEAERHRILEWNDTRVPYSQDKCVHELFEEQVAKSPDAIAVIFEDEEVSYFELNARTNRLAHRLRKLGVGPEVLVGLFVERSVEMVVGLLAILKTGGAYVPLDPEYPAERLAFMAEDADIKVLLCHEATRERVPECAARILDMDGDAEGIAGENSENPLRLAGPNNLAYVIYTSGSTGKPKGVAMPHGALVNLLSWQRTQFREKDKRVVLQFAPLSFDVSFQDILSTLYEGSTLVLAGNYVRKDFALLIDHLITNDVDRIFLPFVALQTLASVSNSMGKLPPLREVITAGEQLRTTEEIQKFFNALPGCVLCNQYGPTETHVVSSYILEGSVSGWAALPPIGRPIANTQLYILDSHTQPVPIGPPGELYIGGVGVARGYLNRPDLTAEKFITDPFSDDPQAYLYRTGDLCRWLPDGNIEYLGRIDTQVKIRGFRIELGEVENALLAHSDVREAVVDARGEEEDKQLVAWVRIEDAALESGAPGEALPLRDALRTHLRASLPDWMVPSVFVFVDTLPLTPSGKIDRRALPAPEASDSTGTEYAAPISPTEELLAGLWAAVLKRETIGRFDNFFDLGGHSLLATQLISRIRDSFDMELPVRMVFEHPELSALADAIQSNSGLSHQLPPIEAQPADALRSLSFAQQRLWFLERFETGGTAAYNMPAALRLEGSLDIHALQASLQWMVERHESLRTVFPDTEGEANVSILPLSAFEFPLHDLRHLPPAEQQLQQRIDEHAARPFDLARGPLFRAEILQLAKENGQTEGGQADDGQTIHVLLINMHHIISDGWSMGVFVREWREAYVAFTEGEPPVLAPLPIQYTDYAAWQRQWLQGEALEQQSDYWRGTLEGSPALLELPTDYPRPAQLNYRGSHYSQTLSADITTALNELSQKQGVTLFMTLLAAFDVLLSRYSGQDDICVGSPIANRTHTHTENLIGFFVNTLVLRTRLNREQGFRALLEQVRQTCLGAYAHQDIPFETLVEQINPTRSLSHSPLFQVMLVLQNNAQAEMEWPGLTMTGLEQDYPIAKFDLTLNMVEQDGQLYCNWEYATSLFREETIRRMGEHFDVLLRAIVAEPETPIAQLPLLTEAERRRILVEWNATGAPYPQDKCVHELFQEQAAKTPDAVAVVFGEEEVSYGELNARANRLAHRLRKLGVGPEVLVGILNERSVEMVVGLLAILKAGGAYVPLDPEYPVERLAFMVGDADIKVLLCHEATRERVPECAAHILDMDAESGAIAEESSENPAQAVGPDNPVYVIYTSGSTGKPKGNQILHQGFVNLLAWYIHAFECNSKDRILVISSPSFDLTQKNFFAPLITGAELYFPNYDFYDPERVLQTINQYKITWINCTPSMLYPVLEIAESEEFRGLSSLRYAVLGGEPIAVRKLYAWLERALQSSPYTMTRVVNSYGPTECTDVCAFHVVEDIGQYIDREIPIGRPITNTQLYILNPHKHPVPIGVPGELYIGGAGVSRGYLNRPDLTSDKFISNPFSNDTIGDDTGARLYRTGDLCRWLPDSTIEYLGRIDTQVKIRGFRIECGEVENALLSHPGVREAVVDARGEGAEKQLVAWVGWGASEANPNEGVSIPDAVGVRSSPQPTDALRTHLRGMLPDWMVPTRFVFLDTLPLTPSGKIDRRALQDPDDDGFVPTHEYTAPRNPTEAMLCGIFAEILNLPRIGIHDDFFDLGGHSLLAIRVLSSIRKEFQLEIPLRALFAHPTPKGLAEVIRARNEWKPSIFLPLKSGDLGAPLFCIHPGGGGAFCYQELADSLGDGRPVYGIQAVGFEGETEPLTDIEAMAAHYVAEITALWPKGPYNLYGWSSGGLVAFEMALQLDALGKEVALLAMIDTVGPDHMDRTEPLKTELELLAYMLVDDGVSVNLDEFGKLEPDEQLRYYLEEMKKMGETFFEDIEDIRRFLRLLYLNDKAMREYRPRVYPGRILYFSARDPHAPHARDCERAWVDLAQEGIEIIKVPGSHFTMHESPHIQVIAKRLQLALDIV
uniref:Amino acid adenylation domain-containing protein n=1 Tax=Candidatus Kentrum sp. FW TaxID=2126338 RepID=A0A450TZ94_9GAMM|nr:MAG: amino acid adenylation domain-containing protein [Candidatus Kentron sp. FW]